jgi:hypothetical protein
MVRTILHKVKWAGKATVLMAGMAMILALVLGVATTALGATGGNFILGKANVAGAVSKLTAGISGAALQVVNNGAGTALDLRVGSSTTPPADKTVAPMKVDSQARVANLNADEVDGRDATSFAASTHTHSGGDITSGTVSEARIDDSVARDVEILPTVQAGDGSGSGLDADHLDGKDSSAFLPVDGKARDATHADRADSAGSANSAASAQNADRLDGIDSTTFGIETQHNQQDLETCYTPTTAPRQACAPLKVVVPPGKRYVVSVWSSFSIYGSWAETQTTQQVRYCSGMQGPGQTQPDCVTPFGVQNAMTARRSEYIPASTSGETLPLTEGTYTFGTIVLPQSYNLSQTSVTSGDTVVTKVLVRDASAPEPTGVTIP